MGKKWTGELIQAEDKDYIYICLEEPHREYIPWKDKTIYIMRGYLICEKRIIMLDPTHNWTVL